MKIAFVDSMYVEAFSKDPPKQKWNQAISNLGVSCISYFPSRQLKKEVKLECEDGKSSIIIIPLSSTFINFFSKQNFSNRRIIRFLVSFVLFFIYALKIMNQVKKEKIDFIVIVHLWDNPLMVFFGPILRFVRPVSVLWMGSSLRRYYQLSKLGYYVIIPVFKTVLSNTAILIPNDIEQNRFLFEILKISKNLVFRFSPCIVDEKVFQPKDRHKSASEVSFDQDNINILTVSRINQFAYQNPEYEKDVFCELEIFKLLVNKRDNVRLHIIGTGSGTTDLKRRIVLYNLQDKVKLYGWVPNEKLPLFYSASSIAFIPQPLIEINDAQAIFESLMCGTPVVAFKRYECLRAEHFGGFLISKNPEIGAAELDKFLDPILLSKKAIEAPLVSIEQNVTMTTWAASLVNIANHLSKFTSQVYKNQAKLPKP